jgi:hypothetical protein
MASRTLHPEPGSVAVAAARRLATSARRRAFTGSLVIAQGAAGGGCGPREDEVACEGAPEVRDERLERDIILAVKAFLGAAAL